MRQKVSIARVADYDPVKVESGIKKIIESLGGWESFVSPGSRVLLKPNLLSARKPEAGVTTHPIIVEKVAESLIDFGVKVAIGDSPGGAHKGVKRVFDNTGMTDVARKLGIEIVNFEIAGVHVIERGRFKLHITKALDDYDFVINLPRLKTHSLMGMTLAIKNMFGVVSGFQKTEYHKYYPKPKDFGEFIVELFNEVKPALSIMDGIVGMEGEGPSSGDLRDDVGLILASDDAVALDSVAERIAGFPDMTRTTRLATEKKYGISDLNQIEILGGNLEDFILDKPFNFPITASRLAQLVPNFLSRSLGRLLWIRPALKQENCIKCSKCKDMCPVEAIEMESGEGYPIFDYKKCVICLCCHEICPVKAIYLERSFLARRF